MNEGVGRTLGKQLILTQSSMKKLTARIASLRLTMTLVVGGTSPLLPIFRYDSLLIPCLLLLAFGNHSLVRRLLLIIWCIQTHQSLALM